MEKDKLVEVLEREASKTTNLMGFLLEVPDLATELTGIHKERIQAINITRLAIAEKWIEEMKKRLEGIYGKETFKSFDGIKSLLEVN